MIINLVYEKYKIVERKYVAFFFAYLNMYILFNMRIYYTETICKKERSNVFNMFYVTYSKMIGDTIVRIHATKNITVITVMLNAIFARFNVLWDFPCNGHLTRSQYHGSSSPLKSKSIHIFDCDLMR